jgi:aminoglycoside 6-adenylyltransferase
MRTEKEIFDLVIDIANNDGRIRAVILNGSRANPNAKKDILCDFDIVYIVAEMGSFLNDHSWINVFGERLIMQMPKTMCLSEKNDDPSFQYLMLFKDGNRIDLTLFPASHLHVDFKKDSLSVLLLDKDKTFDKFPDPTEKDYFIIPPTEKEFDDCCNEFWWVSTNVAKGLWRNEITYAKEMMEIPLRNMFMKMIEWYIGLQTNFSASFGKAGKNMQKHLYKDLYKKILSTYPDAETKNIWKSLFEMTSFFSEFANEIANTLGYDYDEAEEKNVVEYLNKSA